MTPQEFMSSTQEFARVNAPWKVTFHNGKQVDVLEAAWVSERVQPVIRLFTTKGEIRPYASEIASIEVVTLPDDVIAFLEEEAHGPRGNAQQIETSVRQSMYKATQLLQRYRPL